MTDTETEFLLDPNQNRFVMFPIKDISIWEMYQKAEDSFWRVARS